MRRRLRRLGRFMLKASAVWLLLSVVLVLPLRWLEPPASAFMLRQIVLNAMDDTPGLHVFHSWVDWEQTPSHLPLALVAAEDQRFPKHHGFDLVEIQDALKDFAAGEGLRGASTISQQLAKNLYLWPGRDFLRKSLEAWFTGLLELMLPKRRILELYMNFAEFGHRVFGVGAAAERFFGKPVSRLNKREASLLAAVLPNPIRYRVDRPSRQVQRRAQWIRGQMRNLGGRYLRQL